VKKNLITLETCKVIIYVQIIIDQDSEIVNLSSSAQIKEKVDSKKTLLKRKNKTSTSEHDNMVT
jgi:hypothetical protein